MTRERGGWQCKVLLHKGYVIKEPRTYEELRKKSYRWLKEYKRRNERQISEIAKECFDDIKKGKRLIKRSKIPGRYIGNPVFYKDGRVKQERAITLGTKIHNLVKKGKIKEAEKIIDSFFDSIKVLWSYGLHEKPYKLNENFGIIKDHVILLDLFELTDSYDSVKKSLRRGINMDYRTLRWMVTKRMVPYYKKTARKTLNLKTLNECWKKNL